MAHRSDKDDYIFDMENLTQLMESSKLYTDDYAKGGARPKKSRKRTSAKSAEDPTAATQPNASPASSTESNLESERLRHQNLQLQLEIRKAELELAKLKASSREPEVKQEPHLLENVLISTPAGNATPLAADFPTLSQLRDKKKPGATLPHNYVFSSKGTLTYDSLDIPDFVYGFLEFYKEQSATGQSALLKHLQLLMERATTYSWPSVRSFHLAIATAIDQGRLAWTSWDAIRERSQTFFSHQDLRPQSRPTGSHRVTSPFQPLPTSTRSLRSPKETYCRDWNYTGKCSCSIINANYGSTHRCRVCDTTEHPMLQCVKRRFPIPASAASAIIPETTKD